MVKEMLEEANEINRVSCYLERLRRRELEMLEVVGVVAGVIKGLDDDVVTIENPPTVTILSYKQRIVEEKTELDIKANKLSDFIGNNLLFDDLEADEQERLKMQNDIMWQYSEILGKRLTANTELIN